MIKLNKCRKNKTTNKYEENSRKSLIKFIFSISSFILILLITNFFSCESRKRNETTTDASKKCQSNKNVNDEIDENLYTDDININETKSNSSSNIIAKDENNIKNIEKESIEDSSESLSIFYRVIEWIINLLANHQGFLCVLLTIILVTTHGFCQIDPLIKLIGYLPLAIISTCIYFHDNQGNVKKNIGLFIIFIVLSVFSMHVILNLYHGEVFDFSPANIIANFVQVVTIMSILMTIAKKKYS